MTSSLHAPDGGPPVIITGMHRSGTSLLASLFASAGVSLGTRLIGASRGNDRGHYEDLDFYEFHARALDANGMRAEGFACVDEIGVPSSMRDEAAALVATKAAAGESWGWKDPRTSLFLDFWGGILPEGRFVFVFRSPWEVVDSLFRRGDQTFTANPALAARVWLYYNRRIVDFYRQSQSRCLLAEVTQVIADPAALFASVRQRLGVPVGEPAPRYEEPLLVRDVGARREAIIKALLPEAIDLYAEMRRLAGLPAASRYHPPSGAASIAEHAIAEWSQSAIAEDGRRRLEAEHAAVGAALRAAEARIAALDLEKRAIQGKLREVQDVGEELAAYVQRRVLEESRTEAVRAQPADAHAA
ncbi:MAG: sulfotransferase [Planctomycetia bacterium]|nr:sulfotransferase [Planctomycetia bacterium]